jgi:hypothetical protein
LGGFSSFTLPDGLRADRVDSPLIVAEGDHVGCSHSSEPAAGLAATASGTRADPSAPGAVVGAVLVSRRKAVDTLDYPSTDPALVTSVAMLIVPIQSYVAGLFGC